MDTSQEKTPQVVNSDQPQAPFLGERQNLRLDGAASQIEGLGLMNFESEENNDLDDRLNTDVKDTQEIDNPEDTDIDNESEEPGDISIDDAESNDDKIPEIKTLDDLANVLEVDTDFMDNLELTFKADGEDVTVNLSELRKGYQKDAFFRRQTQELAQMREQVKIEQEQKNQQFEQALVQQAQFFQSVKNMLIGEYNTPEMAQLRSSNPGEYAAKVQEFQQKSNFIDQLYGQISHDYTAYQEKAYSERVQQMQDLRRKEIENLNLAIPSWGPELIDQLNSYLNTGYGYSPQELNAVMDSRQIIIAHKAMLYDEMKKAGIKERKKISKIPNTLKPGKNTADKTKIKGLQAAKNKLKKSGSVKDAAIVLSQLKGI